MTTVDRLRDWHQRGVIEDGQYETLAALVRKERFSVFLELSAALYAGVLLLVGGLAWTFEVYFTSLGDPFIVSVCSVVVGGCLYYCFTHAAPYAHGEVESADLALDYVLYLACLVLSAELTYLAFRFPWFTAHWDECLLALVAIFAALAYRFDNRFVLSLALTSLAGWFGVKVSAFGWASPAAFRTTALAYATVVAVAGLTLHKQDVKPHFLEAYLHVAAIVAFAAVVSGVRDPAFGALYTLALAGMTATAVALGVRHSRFAFVAYGIVYGYAGVSRLVLAHLRGDTEVLGYFVVTGALVVVALVILARRFAPGE
jgi:hypothetical protein